ncbi:MAG TPA: hypothetical protein VFX59_12505, partial [Polyangiales bacterium]|nr:hypothetical protein [Polyangiales bacterium]
MRALPLVLLAGCTELVVIGDECREQSACIVELDGRVVEVPLDASLDARTPDLDAGLTPELDGEADGGFADHYVPAPDDASVWMTPALINPSFEVTDGQPGDVTAVSLPTATVIAPWFSCQPVGGGPGALTGVRAETRVAVND